MSQPAFGVLKFKIDFFYILQLIICHIKLSRTLSEIQHKSLPIAATINNNNINISQSTQDRIKSNLPVQYPKAKHVYYKVINVTTHLSYYKLFNVLFDDYANLYLLVFLKLVLIISKNNMQDGGILYIYLVMKFNSRFLFAKTESHLFNLNM